MNDLTIDVTKDAASPAVAQLMLALASSALRRHVGAAATSLTQGWLRGLPPNRQGWPSQGFYDGAARGTAWEPTLDGVRVLVDNPDAPGAMKHQYNGGVPGKTRIAATDKLLTVPARAEFYGHRAGEFEGLRFGMFRSGAKFLYIQQGGASLVDFSTGRSRSKGIGARSAMMVAYWLVPEVEQDAKPEVLPSREAYLAAVKAALEDGVRKLMGGRMNN